jgi:hypothetical protein
VANTREALKEELRKLVASVTLDGSRAPHGIALVLRLVEEVAMDGPRAAQANQALAALFVYADRYETPDVALLVNQFGPRGAVALRDSWVWVRALARVRSEFLQLIEDPERVVDILVESGAIALLSQLGPTAYDLIELLLGAELHTQVKTSGRHRDEILSDLCYSLYSRGLTFRNYRASGNPTKLRSYLATTAKRRLDDAQLTEKAKRHGKCGRTLSRYRQRSVDVDDYHAVEAEAAVAAERKRHRAPGLLSQRQFAATLGVSPGHVARVLGRAAGAGVYPKHHDDRGNPRFTGEDISRFRPFARVRRPASK